jgi:hypothetical protein
MSASQENACLKSMTPAPKASDAAVSAFAGIPARLDRTPALILRGRTLDCERLLGPMNHPFHVSIRGGRYIAPVLVQISRQSISNKQGEHV